MMKIVIGLKLEEEYITVNPDDVQCAIIICLTRERASSGSSLNNYGDAAYGAGRDGDDDA